jgi:hypothetical protein
VSRNAHWFTPVGLVFAGHDLTFAKLLILKRGCGVDLRVRCRDWPD